MTTPVRRRGRTLRQRLLGYITDATDRLKRAWSILTIAQTRLLNALAAIRPGFSSGTGARLRAAIAAFNTSLGVFARTAGAFAERWASVDLPVIYREGAWTLLDNADRRQSTFTWTPRHQAAITAASAQYYADLTNRIQEALRRARAFLRAAQDAARDTTRGTFDISALRQEYPLDTVVYANNARHPVDAWARAAITWQAVTTANTAAARTALDELGTEWLEVRDGHGCGWETHDSADKADRTLRTVQDALAHPSAHPHCVVEGTEVQAVGGIQRGYKFLKSGRLVRVSTAGGKQLTITPNHPILTGRGWVPAGQIQEGDDLFVRSEETGKAGTSCLADFDQMPAPVEQVFAALGQASASASTVAASEDFHGDGPTLNCEVDVVGADGELWRVVDAASSEQGAELNLKVADPVSPELAADGPLLKEFDRLDLAASRGVGRCDVRRVTIPAAGLDAPFLESVPDGRFAKSEFIREAQDRLSIAVSTDDVVEVRYFDSAVRHVYDLSTSEHAYFANGILVHNCVREFLPRLDLIGRTDIQSGALL